MEINEVWHFDKLSIAPPFVSRAWHTIRCQLHAFMSDRLILKMILLLPPLIAPLTFSDQISVTHLDCLFSDLAERLDKADGSVNARKDMIFTDHLQQTCSSALLPHRCMHLSHVDINTFRLQLNQQPFQYFCTGDIHHVLPGRIPDQPMGRWLSLRQ